MMPMKTFIYFKKQHDMWIIVMDYNTGSVTKLAWDIESATSEEIEILLERIGYRMSEISYMTTEEEPVVGLIEVSDILDG